MRVSRSDHGVCAKLVVRPGKPDSPRRGARTRDVVKTLSVRQQMPPSRPQASRGVSRPDRAATRSGEPQAATSPADRVGNHERQGWGETTDQLRTTPAELSARQRSTMDTSDKWVMLDNRERPIWGSRGRRFKSRQPDNTMANCHAEPAFIRPPGHPRQASVPAVSPRPV